MKRQPRAMTEEQWRRWNRIRAQGRLRFLATWGGGMALAYYALFVPFFGCAGKAVFNDDVHWGALMLIAAPCSVAFGAGVAHWAWRTEEADYRSTPRADRAPQ